MPGIEMDRAFASMSVTGAAERSTLTCECAPNRGVKGARHELRAIAREADTGDALQVRLDEPAQALAGLQLPHL